LTEPGTTHAQQLLTQFRSLNLAEANEAATRLKVIDRVLRQVLGWSEDDIDPEEHVSEDGKTTYSDYILRTANTALVIEAKKAGADFTTPPGRRREKLSQQFLSGELGKAIVQARDYARKLGIDFAIATNGSIWAIFPAQRHDQVTFHESSAIVFWSLEDFLKDNYQEFVDLLARDSVISGSLEVALFGRAANQLADRKLRNYFTPGGRSGRTNPVYPVIEDAIVLAFSDNVTTLSDEHLDRSYVATPETIRFDSKIRMTVAKRQQVTNQAVLRALKDKDAKHLDQKLQAAVSGRKPLALLLLGTVGAGKTTFLQYLRRIRLREMFEPKADKAYPHWVNIDFLETYPGGTASDYIYSELFDYIKREPFLSDFERCIRHAYAEEIQSLKSGPLFLLNKDQEKLDEHITELIFNDYKAKQPYVDKIITYATRNAPFFLVIDNVDQIEDESVQSRLFTEALSVARHLSINLVLCLRQSTYVQHRNSPGINAFDFEIAQIDPPRIASVLSKRFTLAKSILEGTRGEFIAENGARVKVENAAEIIDLVQGSVLGTEIGRLIEVLATEDVRLALRMTREFLERGYTSPGRAIQLHKRTGTYVLPRHEAFRAILLGTNPVYNEDFSALGNPFDSKLSIQQAQLLRLFVLTAIVNYASGSEFRSIDGSLIAEQLRRIGFGDKLTERVLVDLCRHRFLFTASHGAASLSSSFVPSRLGGYVVRDLIGDFTFLENTLFDTYIEDSATWEKLRSLSHQIESERDILKRVKLRKERILVFYAELQRLYGVVLAETHRRALPAEWCHNPLTERAFDLRSNLARVMLSARRTARTFRRESEVR
jgi:GTPase SAR1 family protein